MLHGRSILQDGPKAPFGSPVHDTACRIFPGTICGIRDRLWNSRDSLRAIRNRFMDRVMSGEKIPHSPCHQCLHTCSPSDIPYCITDALVNAAKGQVDDALLFCGANAWKAEKIETVKEVIQSLL